MKQLTTFLFGVTTGMYIAQNYDAPVVTVKFNQLLDFVKKYEKRDN
jgi:hypothetical protein